MKNPSQIIKVINLPVSRQRREKGSGEEALYLIALSGGADSVCLLRMMLEKGYRVHAAHCNFKLRGEESDRDELFCKDLCQRLGVELHLIHFDTRTYAELHKVSIEMAARELRYAYFEQLRQSIGAEDILVAHHRDDNVETFLLNVIRGTGIHGLQAIKPRNGHIVRPLLNISRQEILDYLTLIHQDYVTDSSNLVDDVQRNKVRLNLIPLLETINPAAVQNIQRTIDNVSEAVKVFDAAVEQGVMECVEEDVAKNLKKILLPRLLAQPSPEQVLFSILTPLDFTPAQIKQIYQNLDAPSGRQWESTTYVLARDRDSLLIGRKADFPQTLPAIRLPETGLYIYNVREREYKIQASVSSRTPDFRPSKDPFCVTLDADKVRFPLTVRGVTSGDAFVPFGMRGRKLISDYLTDRKRNFFERRSQLLVEDANGTIQWLIGERSSQLSAYTEDTINILTLRYLSNG